MSEHLKQKFFSDPEWPQVEKIIMDFLAPLMEMEDIDVKQPAEHIKAEVVGRQLLYKRMTDFLSQVGMVKDPTVYKPTRFR